MKNYSISYAVPANDSIGGSRMCRRWRNVTQDWAQLVRLCTNTLRTSETMDEYQRMKKSADRSEKQRAADIKDVGGFFGGILDQSGLRQKSHVVSRTLVTLDIDDTAHKMLTAADIWQSFLDYIPGTAGVAYTTHTHTPQAPRMRLVIPLARPVSPEEYGFLAQAISLYIGTDLMDTTAFSTEHFMYWPSTSADGEFLHFVADGRLLDPDTLIRLGRQLSAGHLDKKAGDVSRGRPCLAERRDARHSDEHRELVESHQVPRHAAMASLTGDELRFCQKYTVEEAIDRFLASIYTDRRGGTGPAETARYTYAPAGSADGLVCYDNYWAHSFHNTDPACGRNLNAYQLVRLHLYGHLDKNSRAIRRGNLPSTKAMRRLCGDDLSQKDRDPDGDWMSQLQTSGNGAIRPTATNIDTIFLNDPALGKNIRYDICSDCIRCTGEMVWDKGPRLSSCWTDADDCFLRAYVDKHYNIRNRPQLIYDAVTRLAKTNGYHPIQEYLQGLPKWDGTPRVETLLCDYLGACDTQLTRQITRKWLAAAVKRVFEPGCKFDYCLVLKGGQGAGKSSVFEVLGGDYHNGSLNQIEGREGREGLQGCWIVEFSELSALRRSEVEAIKAFITDCTDRYRPAYGRRSVEHKRQCVFCATTNSDTFLKDDTGNRRFWVVEVDPARTGEDTPTRIARLRANRDQIWAEAYGLYLSAEKMYLDKELEQQLKEVQQRFIDNDDDLADRLDTYLETPLPPGWLSMSMADRRLYYSSATVSGSYQMLQQRSHFTVREFVCEMLQSHPDRLDMALFRRIKRLMRNRPGWEEIQTSTIRTGWAGYQRGFVKAG